jgi:murein DD-endopeptidase MepM/ murein hydrolase activator NlpD
MRAKFFFFLLFCLFCVGCDSKSANPQDSIPVNSTAIILPTNTPFPTLQPTTTPIIPSSTPIFVNQICSPLQGETLTSISQIITQPFKMPPLGSDDSSKGHHGVDFSYYRRNGRIGIQGLPVYSSLQGIVIAVLKQKEVYGNAIIIETPLEQIPSAWLAQLQLPEIAPTIVPNQRLTCPSIKDGPNSRLNVNKRSLYLLYAHLEQPPQLHIGDSVNCGQQIGLVGNSGRSTNPHLHVEVRIGPSGAIFEGMDHYIASSSDLERYNYCIWRVSNLFELTDPMKLFNLKFNN